MFGGPGGPEAWRHLLWLSCMNRCRQGSIVTRVRGQDSSCGDDRVWSHAEILHSSYSSYSVWFVSIHVYAMCMRMLLKRAEWRAYGMWFRRLTVWLFKTAVAVHVLDQPELQQMHLLNCGWFAAGLTPAPTPHATGNSLLAALAQGGPEKLHQFSHVFSFAFWCSDVKVM